MITTDESIKKSQSQLDEEQCELNQNVELTQSALCEIKKDISERILAAVKAGHNQIEIKNDNVKDKEILNNHRSLFISIRNNGFMIESDYYAYKKPQYVIISWDKSRCDYEYKVDFDLISVSQIYDLLEQRELEWFNNHYKERHDEKKLEYDIAKIFIYKIPFWKYLISLFFIIYPIYTINLLIETFVSNNSILTILLLSIFKIISCFIIMLMLLFAIMASIMYFTKPNKKYFDSVVNEVDKQFQSKFIELGANIRKPEVEYIVTKFLGQIKDKDSIIFYKDIYDLYKESEEDLDIAKYDMKNAKNKFNEFIERKKQKDNIQDCITKYTS
jgi:hypothetical protein